MSALLSFGIKQPNGTWKNYTASISDTTDKFGNNVSIYETQTKEQREAKTSRIYLSNGKVVWTDGKITVAEKKDTRATEEIEALPF